MSVIVVDNDLKSSIKEYGQIIDTVNQNVEFSESLQAFFKEETNEIIKEDELLKTIYESTTQKNLTQLPDREFEPTFNLILHIYLQLNKSLDAKIIDRLIACNPTEQPSLRDRKTIKSATILSVLNTIFNLLPETSSDRIYTLTKILDVVEASKLPFSLIQSSVGDNLVQWLTKANASEEEIKAIFWKFITLDSRFTLKSLQLIKSFTSTYALIDLNLLIKFALSSDVVDVSFLINNNVAKALRESSNEYADVFTKYTRGELVTSVPSDLPESLILSKSKILALAKFFADENKSVYKYSDITLVSDSTELETLLINAIKAGVVEGKLNQLNETFYLTRVNRFIVAGADNSAHWKNVRDVLVQWKNSVANIDDIVNTSRENIVNNNN